MKVWEAPRALPLGRADESMAKAYKSVESVFDTIQYGPGS